jgi:hypothetical protein
MVKVKVSSFYIDESNVGTLPELELKSFIIKTNKDDQTFSEDSIKNDYMVLMSESEYRERLVSKSARKSNPLLVNFEQYD